MTHKIALGASFVPTNRFLGGIRRANVTWIVFLVKCRFVPAAMAPGPECFQAGDLARQNYLPP
jgi:hypothetical protein